MCVCSVAAVMFDCLQHYGLGEGNGIWDRRLKADPKTNLIVSLIGGLVAGIFSCIPVFRNFGVTPGLLTLVMAFLFAAGLCFVALSLSASAYKKRVRKLEHEAEAEEN